MEQEKALYQSPEILVVSFAMQRGFLLNNSNNGEMGNGGFLDE